MRYAFNAVIAIISIMLFLSCNKNNNVQSTTKIKCVTCANGGLCLNDTCRCPAGYEGVSCQTASRDKFINDWNVMEKGTITSTRQYTIEIEENFSSAINTVQINNFYNDFSFSQLVAAYVSGDSLYIPSQHISGKIIVGVGYIHSDPTFGTFGAITMRYMVTDSITGQVDDFGYNSMADSPSSWIR